MRIAHLTWSLGIGGIQTMLVDIANIQVREGHEVGIFVVDSYVSNKIIKKLDPKVQVFFMGRTRGKKQILPFIKLNIQVRLYNPDIIHSHAGKLINILLCNAPSIGTIHTSNTFFKDYKKYNRLTAISKSIQSEWEQKWGIKPVLIEDAIDCNHIKTKTVNNKTKLVRFVQVSRIIFSIKGQDILAKAFSMLLREKNERKRLANIDCQLVFIGDGLDFEKLKQLVHRLNIQDHVVFEGFKEREWVFDHLCDYDLFVQPSLHEGFGLTVAEACAAKVPVLVSDIEGPLEIIDGGKLGMTFKCGNIDDLSRKLFQFLERGADSKIVDKAYTYTHTHYDLEKMVERYMAEYEELLKKK